MYISESDKTLIRQVIERQLQSFQNHDYDTVFSLASPTVQNNFSQQDFIKMVKDQYLAMLKPRSFMFRGFTLVNNFPALVSTIMDQEGSLAQGVFIVQQQKDYSWRIHGYELVPLDIKII